MGYDSMLDNYSTCLLLSPGASVFGCFNRLASGGPGIPLPGTSDKATRMYPVCGKEFLPQVNLCHFWYCVRVYAIIDLHIKIVVS